MMYQVLLKLLKIRFELNMNRHENMDYNNVEVRLKVNIAKLNSLNEIRKLGGVIFGDFRFNTIFMYDNGAKSYYAGEVFVAF